jgi:hypothetical protein
MLLGFVYSKSLLVRLHCSLSGKGIVYCQQVESYAYQTNASPRLLLSRADTCHGIWQELSHPQYPPPRVNTSIFQFHAMFDHLLSHLLPKWTLHLVLHLGTSSTCHVSLVPCVWVFPRDKSRAYIRGSWTSFLAWCFFDRASKYRLISFANFIAQFLYSLTICMLRYNPRHVSSINMPICTAVYREWRYQMLWWYNLSSWRWACWCSKHVEDCNVAYILLMNKGIVR